MNAQEIKLLADAGPRMAVALGEVTAFIASDREGLEQGIFLASEMVRAAATAAFERKHAQ